MYVEIRPIEPIWEKYTRKDELYSLKSKELRIRVHSDIIQGTLDYRLSAGYFTDFRSGSNIINPIIPKIGNTLTMVAWLVHDINYHGFLSRKYSDMFLREMLEYAQMGKVKRNAVYYAVRAFGGSHYNSLDEDQGPIYNKNLKLVKFQWTTDTVSKYWNGRPSEETFSKYPILINRTGG